MTKLNKNAFPEVPNIVHNAVLNALDNLDTERVRVSRPRFTRTAAAMLCLLLVGATALAAGAVMTYRQRMEAMTEEELSYCYTIAGSAEATTFSRALTNDETVRLEALASEYDDGRFPAETLSETSSADGMSVDAASRLISLPEGELTDEQLLQIIDFNRKLTYSIYQKNDTSQLDDTALDRIYLAAFNPANEISGAYSRELTAAEQSRYAELTAAYESGEAQPFSEAAIIANPEDYTGEGVAICTADSSYYLPESEMDDDALLQLIDFEHKSLYALDEIGRQIDLGLRDGYPVAE